MTRYEHLDYCELNHINFMSLSLVWGREWVWEREQCKPLRQAVASCALAMPKGKTSSGRGGAASKKKDRAVREALRKERKSGAYLDPVDPDFRSFRNQLQAQGLKVHDVPGDG